MGDPTVSGLVIVCGWLIASAFLVAAYWRAGPVWVERHSLRFKLAGKDRRCSGAIGEMALLGACALLLWAVDATTPEMNFVAVIARYPWGALGALVFVSGIVAAYAASAVEHPDAATKKRLRQTYAIYAPYSTLVFGGGMVLIYCIVTQFIADADTFNAAGAGIVSRAANAAAGAHRAVEFSYVDGMILLARAKNQMTPVFIFAIAIFSINLLILYTPMRRLYTTNAVFLTNVSTLIAIGAVAAAGAVLGYAEAEYAKGNRVVIGGDWNYEFHRPVRPTTTGEKYLFRVHPFPYSELADRWEVAIGKETPSVRAESVKTRELDFQLSDHQPVDARFVAAK
jgi:hypothetical protein